MQGKPDCLSLGTTNRQERPLPEVRPEAPYSTRTGARPPGHCPGHGRGAQPRCVPLRLENRSAAFRPVHRAGRRTATAEGGQRHGDTNRPDDSGRRTGSQRPSANRAPLTGHSAVPRRRHQATPALPRLVRARTRTTPVARAAPPRERPPPTAQPAITRPGPRRPLPAADGHSAEPSPGCPHRGQPPAQSPQRHPAKPRQRPVGNSRSSTRLRRTGRTTCLAEQTSRARQPRPRRPQCPAGHTLGVCPHPGFRTHLRQGTSPRLSPQALARRPTPVSTPGPTGRLQGSLQPLRASEAGSGAIFRREASAGIRLPASSLAHSA